MTMFLGITKGDMTMSEIIYSPIEHLVASQEWNRNVCKYFGSITWRQVHTKYKSLCTL